MAFSLKDWKLFLRGLEKLAESDSGPNLQSMIERTRKQVEQRQEAIQSALKGWKHLPEALEEPVLRSAAALAELGAITLVGFDLDDLARQLPAANVVAARPLAPRLIELAAALPIDWDPRLLTEPLYLRSAATTPPRSPASGLG